MYRPATLLIFAWGWASFHLEALPYILSELPLLPGGMNVQVEGLNDHGDVVRCSDQDFDPTKVSPLHPVLWRNGAIVDLGIPAGTSGACGTGVNNVGQAVGHVILADASRQGFLWRNGAMALIPNSKCAINSWTSCKFRVNDAGQIAGTVNPSGTSFSNTIPYVRQSGVPVQLFPGTVVLTSFVSQITAAGQVLGRRRLALQVLAPFLWDLNTGAVQDIGSLVTNFPDWNFNLASAQGVYLNSSGTITGTADHPPFGKRGFLM